MSRVVTDSLFRRLIDAFPADRNYDRDALSADPMPPPVAHFLAHWLRERAEADAQALAMPSDWFDADHPDVRRAVRSLQQVLVAHAHVPAGAWKQTLRQAVEHVVNHLVRPVSTLVDLVFGDDEALPVAVVNRRLGLFTSYPYLPDTARLYFEQKEVEHVRKGRLADLLRHIDRQMTEDYGTDDWVRHLQPLFAFVRRTGRERVPVEMLAAFFEEKEAHEVVRRLNATQEEGHETLDEAALREVLEPPAQDEPPEAAPEPEAEATPEPEPRGTPALAEDEPGMVPLWKRFQQGRRQAPPPRPAERLETPRASPPAMPRWKQFRRETPPQPVSGANRPSAPKPGLSALEHRVLGELGPKNRQLFVRELFADSIPDYEEAMRRLHAAPSWADASQIIGEVFKANHVNIYSDAAVLFTDAVQERYA